MNETSGFSYFQTKPAPVPHATHMPLGLVRVEVVETSSQVWKTCILTAVLHSRTLHPKGNTSIIAHIFAKHPKLLIEGLLFIHNENIKTFIRMALPGLLRFTQTRNHLSGWHVLTHFFVRGPDLICPYRPRVHTLPNMLKYII